MDDFARSIFRGAVLREEAAYNLYADLAKKANKAVVRDMFHKLAAEELIHKQLFSKMDSSVLKKVNRGQLGDLYLLKDVEQIPLSFEEKKEMNETLDYAIMQEQRAFDDYSSLANFMSGEAKEVLQEVALQESRHKMLLQKVKLEFNKNKWKVLK